LIMTTGGLHLQFLTWEICYLCYCEFLFA
jgi:hypothetical protein